jgi:hypothetical protein
MVVSRTYKAKIHKHLRFVKGRLVHQLVINDPHKANNNIGLF